MHVVKGDFNGDGKTDIALIGGSGWNTVPVAFSNGDGTFKVTNVENDFLAAVATQGAQIVTGDFNGDGKTDIALIGGPGWGSVVVAFSNGDGSFNVTNVSNSFLAAVATQGAQIVTGDFNGDGKTDIALIGGPGWGSVPVAFSNGDGSFNVTNEENDFLAAVATQGAQIVTGDFNGDGKTDIALIGGPGWGTVPVAFSNGDGSFNVTNVENDFLAAVATQGAQIVTGDFNGDGKTDIALIGGPGWGSVPVAFSNGDGSFNVTNVENDFLAALATQGAQIVTGDFNGDGKTDIAMIGGQGWGTVPVAFSNGDGSFSVTNNVVITPPPPLTPVFNPRGGTFTSAQSVSITSAGATAIYYTTNGTTPTTASRLYTTPVAIAKNTVLQAIGVNSNGSSSVGTVSFTILSPAPVFNPVPGTYANVTAFPVSIKDATNAKIYYTTDGSTPTAGSTPYTAAVPLPIGTTTLSAIAVDADGSSTVTAGTYILTPPPLVNRQWGPNNFADFVANKPIVVDPATGYVVSGTLGPVAQAFQFNDGNSTVYLANGPVTLSSPNNPSSFQIIENLLLSEGITPGAPTGLKVGKNSADTATPPTTQLLSWTAPSDDSDVAGYNIYNGSTLVGAVSPDVTSFPIPMVNASNSYTVQSFDSDNNLSTAATIIVSVTDSGPLPSPSTIPNLDITGNTGTTVSLSWSAPTGFNVAGYNIYEEPVGDIDPTTGGNTGPTLVGTTSSTTTALTAKSLTGTATYYFTVQAFDSAGNLSPLSNPVEITPKAPAFPATKQDDPAYKAFSPGSASGTFSFPSVTSGTLASPQTFPFDGGTDTITFAAAPVTISGLYITSGTLASPQSFPFNGGQSKINLAAAPVTISGTDITSGTLASTQYLPFGNGSTTSNGQSTIPFAAGRVTISGTDITSGTLAAQESFPFGNGSNGTVTLAPGYVVFSGPEVTSGTLATPQSFQLSGGTGTFTLAAAPVTFSGVYVKSGTLATSQNLPFGNGLSTSDGKFTIPFAAARVTFNAQNGALTSGTLASAQSFNIATPVNDPAGVPVTVTFAAAPVTFMGGANFSGTLAFAQSLTINGGSSVMVSGGTAVKFVSGYYQP